MALSTFVLDSFFTVPDRTFPESMTKFRGVVVGIAGVFFATLHYLSPAAGVELTLLAIVLAIWAGVGRLGGVLTAGILLGMIETVTVAWTGPRWRELMVATILLGSLLARSRGLARGWGH